MAWDDLWLGVICQSNSEIAGSPRNIFRYSVHLMFYGLELLDGTPSLGEADQPNSEYVKLVNEQ